MASPFLYQIQISYPAINLFFLFNALCFVGGHLLIWRVFLLNRMVLVRPAFSILLAINLIYQLPLSLLSEQFRLTLSEYWYWSILINSTAAALLLYVFVTRNQYQGSIRDLAITNENGLSFKYIVPLIALLLIFSIAYLETVQFKCTGLYALVADPSMTLLAREFGIKIIGSSFATYAYGAVANAIAPALLAVSLYQIIDFSIKSKYLNVLFYLIISVCSVFFIMLGGIKGLFLPTLILLVVTGFLWNKGGIRKITSILLSISFIFFSILSFELIRERPTMAGANYNFAKCAYESGKCSESMVLIKSLGFREDSLGLSKSLVGKIKKELEYVCSTDDAQIKVKPLEGGKGIAQGTEIDSGRAVSMLNSIVNRALITPLQVTVWHFLYAENFEIDGKLTLPIARRIWGESMNMPEIVYQKYGSIYSGGDRTSTSTAPTSYLWSYPAYLGVVGIIISLGLVVLVDIVWLFLIKRVNGSLVPLFIGLSFVMAMNFMASDFLTVMISHGGVVSLLLLVLFGLVNKGYKC